MREFYCDQDKEITQWKHLHDRAHGIAGTHMAGSERYVCDKCGASFGYQEAAKRGLGHLFMFDRPSTAV